MENLDSSKEGKCLIRCGLAAFGVMKEDGSIDPDNSVKYVMHAYSQSENQAKATELWKECQKKVEKVDDHCEYAYGLISCFVDAAHKSNIPKIHEDKH